MQLRPLFSLLGSPVRNRPRAFGALTLAFAVPALLGAAPAAGEVSATVSGLRSAKGQVLACMTSRPDAFPDCAKDPDAKAVRVPAAESVELDFGEVAPGRYAISLFHDENGNGKLDKRLMMPREGYGFSRNAPVMLGPPRFARAAFPVGGGDAHQSIRMRYLL